MSKLKMLKRFIWFLIVITATMAFSMEIQNYTLSMAHAADADDMLTSPPPTIDIKFKDPPPKNDEKALDSKELVKKLKKTLSLKEKYELKDIKTTTPDGEKVKICSLTLLIVDEDAFNMFTDEKDLKDNIATITDILAQKNEDDFIGYGLRAIKEEIMLNINAFYNMTIVDEITFEKLEIKSVELDKTQTVTPEAVKKTKEQEEAIRKFEERVDKELQAESWAMMSEEIARNTELYGNKKEEK